LGVKMDKFFPKIRIGCLNDHFDILGGGTVHSFKFLEYLKEYYDIDVFLPKAPKTEEWMKTLLNLDTKGLTFKTYAKGVGEKYNYMFLNISHWRAEETIALKKYMLVFFPQFFFPIFDYEFLANSKYTKKNIVKRWKRTAEKIHVIYPPIMTSQFTPGEKKNYIMHVSRITPPVPEADKGHRQMIQAFKDMVEGGLKGWTFYMVGQVQDRTYLQELTRMAAGYPIKILEGIPFSNLTKLYSESKIYWHMTGVTLPKEPGAQEHFGMTTVEAMSSGAVPVALNTGGQSEIIIDKVSGFLVKGVDELKDKTLSLIKNEKLLEKMSKQAIERSKHFDEEVSKKNLFSVVSKTDKVSIITLCYNNSKFTKECIERLYEVTPPGFELILVDNASEDNTKGVLKNLKKTYSGKGHDIKCIFNKKNHGFAKGNNIGLAKATRPYICYLNNDTLPQWGWLERMVDVLETKKDAGVVGAKLYFPKTKGGEWKVQHAGVELTREGKPNHIGRYQLDKQVRKVGIEEVIAVTGACMLVRKGLAEFNEKFVRGYFEDIDLCFRANLAKYKTYINHEAKLIHYEGKTQDIAKRRDRELFDRISEKNKELFHKLWDKKMSKLSKVSGVVDVVGVEGVNNVEIGGGNNPLYPGYTQVDLLDIPRIKYKNDARLLPFATSSLSNICACYVLQCLTQPEAEVAIKEWFRCLKPGGKLEIHVPNIDKAFRSFIADHDSDVLKEIYGEQDTELNHYNWGWDFTTLEQLLSRANFVRLGYINPPEHRPDSLSVKVFKPGGAK